MNDDYTIMRQFADSWGLLGMLLFFVAAIVLAYRPTAKKIHDDAASIPFKEND
jgi:cytochrome c oxidase cbb3-type subunit IV